MNVQDSTPQDALWKNCTEFHFPGARIINRASETRIRAESVPYIRANREDSKKVVVVEKVNWAINSFLPFLNKSTF